MGIYRGPGGSGDATNDASSETRLAVEARDDAILAKLAAQSAQAAAEVAQAAAEASAASIDTTNFVEVSDIGSTVQAYDADLTTWAGKTAPTGTVVGTSDSQTLTNKTLTAPVISSISNTGTLTLPTSTDTLVGRATSDTLTNKTLTDPAIVGAILEDIYTITDGAAFEIDPGNGTIQLITLGASRTPKATNFSNGESVTMMVLDGTAYTLTWTDSTFGGSGVVWVGGSAPTLDTTKYTVIELWKVGNQVYGAYVGAA